MVTLRRRVSWAGFLAALAALSLCAGGGCAAGSDRDETSCFDRAVFGDPSESPYVLPYRVGTSHRVLQSYCGPLSHGSDGQLSIDFEMPVGTGVLAARAGTVRKVLDGFADFGPDINCIYVEHDDGTVAFYAHLRPTSIVVRLGDEVAAGQQIAASGASGTSIPHLHFGVSSRWPPDRQDDVPVNFRNARGPLDERRGLQAGMDYEALREGVR